MMVKEYVIDLIFNPNTTMLLIVCHFCAIFLLLKWWSSYHCLWIIISWKTHFVIHDGEIINNILLKRTANVFSPVDLNFLETGMQTMNFE